jgi:sugar lactone lactonase YvrE
MKRLSPLVALVLTGITSISPLFGAEPPAAPAGFLLEWGRHGTGPGEFDFPIGIAVAPGGDVLVTDFYNARVQRFGPGGKHLATFPVLPNPGGIAIDGEGHFYLTHFSAMRRDEVKKPDRVSVYNAQGRLRREWGRSGNGDGEFDYPGGIALSSDGRVYVADQTNRRVQVFDRDGKFLFKWGSYGTKNGQFGGNITPKSRVGGPQFLAIDPAGSVFTTEASMGRVQEFAADGRFLRAWGENADRPGSLGGAFDGSKRGLQGPIGICLDALGRVWVSSAGGRVQQFTRDGKYLRGVGDGRGEKPGQFRVPHGLASDGRGHLYVADSYNHRVQKFAIDPSRPGSVGATQASGVDGHGGGH